SAACTTPATIGPGPIVGPESNLRGVSRPEARILTWVPPTSITRMFIEDSSEEGGGGGSKLPDRSFLGRGVIAVEARLGDDVGHSGLLGGEHLKQMTAIASRDPGAEGPHPSSRFNSP